MSSSKCRVAVVGQAKRLRKNKWYPIPGFPHYEFMFPDKVRSLDRAVVQKHSSGKSMVCTYKGKMLSPFVNHKGYLQTSLSEGVRTITITIHKIVALIFHGTCPDGMEVNHKDGDKSNNHPSNLEYITMPENMRHAARMGLRPRGENHPCFGKLFGMHVNGKPHPRPSLGKKIQRVPGKKRGRFV